MSTKKDCPEHKHVLTALETAEKDRLRLWGKNNDQDNEIGKKVGVWVACWSYGLILGLILMFVKFEYEVSKDNRAENRDFKKDQKAKMLKMIKGVKTGDWSDLSNILDFQGTDRKIDSLYKNQEKIDLRRRYYYNTLRK